MTREDALNNIKEAKGITNILLAMRILSKAGNVSDIPALMPYASNTTMDATVRKQAIDTICTIIKESMLTKFNELSPAMRQQLAIILQTLDPQIVGELTKDLFSNDNERKMFALQMLGILRRHPRVKDLLIKLLPDKDPKIKATVVNLLGKMIGPSDQQIVAALLNDEDKRVRANTIEALEQMKNPRLIPLLLKYRREPNNRIRGNVLKALYNLGHVEIEEDLLNMLTSKEPLQKASALWVIKQVAYNRSQRVLDAAGACLISDDSMVHRNAITTLSALTESPRAQGFLKYLDIPLVKVN